MQKIIGIAALGVALLVAFWSPTGLAQGNCGNIVFGEAITSQFPNAKNACLGVVTRDGRQFAHFQGRIRSVRGSQVEAEFKQADGTWGRPVAFSPEADARARVAGRSYRYRDLTRGQELDIYLPPDRWEIAVQADESEFETARVITFVALVEPTQQVAALPSTGSPLPLLALIGVLLAALGAGVVAPLRRRLDRQA